MKHVVPTAEGGHMRICPTVGGEGVQLEIFGSRGGFLGACMLEASNVQALIGAIERAEAEAVELFGRLVEEALEAEREIKVSHRPQLTAVPDLALH